MTAKTIKQFERVALYLMLALAGWIVVYLGCWLFESPINGEAIRRWSAPRCFWATIASLLALAFFHGASQEIK